MKVIFRLFIKLPNPVGWQVPGNHPVLALYIIIDVVTQPKNVFLNHGVLWK